MNWRYNNNPANLNKRITFLLPPKNTDEDGFPIENKEWKPFKPVWAEIKTLKGKEFYQAASDQLQDVKQIGIRYRNDVDENMRIQHKNKIYKIISMNNDDENNQWLTIQVREVSENES